MNTQVPPQLPPGWVALWDETSQRYYYMEQASGTTQWEIPTEASRGMTQGRGEADSYGSGFPQPGGFAQPQNNTSYPQQNSSSSSSSYPQQPIGYPQQQDSPGFPSQQQSYSSGYPEKSYPDSPQQPYPPNNAVATSYPTQQDYNNNESTTGQPGMVGQGELDGPVGPNGERGIGKVFKGFSGGAITGTLIGFAAGKLLGNNNQPHGGGHQQYGNYGPPPPQGYGNYGPPPPQGYGNYGPPPPQGYGGYAPPPPQGYGKPPKKHHFW